MIVVIVLFSVICSFVESGEESGVEPGGALMVVVVVEVEEVDLESAVNSYS